MTIVEGDQKAPFSIATTLRCRGRRLPLSLDCSTYPWSIPYNAEYWAEASSTIFWVFGMNQPGIEPWSPGPLANTLTIMPMVCRNTIQLIRKGILSVRMGSNTVKQYCAMCICERIHEKWMWHKNFKEEGCLCKAKESARPLQSEEILENLWKRSQNPHSFDEYLIQILLNKFYLAQLEGCFVSFAETMSVLSY